MTVTTSVNMMLAKKGLRQIDLATALKTTKSNMSNKFQRNTWTCKELVAVADLLGASVVVRFPDGQEIPIDDRPDQSEPE